jgi:PKD repeat protein
VALASDLQTHTTFIPSLDAGPVGHEFLYWHQKNQGFFVYALADTIVRFFNASGGLVASNTMHAGTVWEPSTLSNAVYRVVATGVIAMQTTGTTGYTSVPSSTGASVGRHFVCATTRGTTGALVVLAYEDATVTVFDLESGQLLYTQLVPRGTAWFQSGVGTRRLRLDSTGDVEVWAGDTAGGTTLAQLGDDLSVTTGRQGQEFYLPSLGNGVVVFAPQDGTTISLDNGARLFTLDRDSFVRLLPTDLLPPLSVHRLSASQPVVVQTLGSASGFSDEGTYLGGVSARHVYTTPGVYPLTLTVTDRAGQTHTATTTVTVRTGTPPVPHITAPALVDEHSAVGGQWVVTFDGSGSQDDYGIFSYAWDFGDGFTASGVNPTHMYTRPGVYTVQLTVTDYAGQRSTTTTTVTVTAGQPPVARAGGPYTVGEEAAERGIWRVTLDGRGSQDDVGLYSYEWLLPPLLDQNFAGTTLDTTQWFVSPGVTQNEVLTVVGANQWGNRYFFSSASFPRGPGTLLQAQVLPPPVTGDQMIWGFKHSSAVGTSYTHMLYGLMFNLGKISVYEDGTLRANNVGTYKRGVTYDLRITLKAQGATYEFKPTSATTWTLLYDSTYASATPLKVGGSVFSGTFTIDNMQVAEVPSGAVVSKTFQQPGVYPVTLRVRDHALQTATDTTTITVTKGQPPVARVGGPYSLSQSRLVQFTGSASTDDVAIASYFWDFGDNLGSTEANPVHVYARPGMYTVTLTTTDNALQSATATTTVQTGKVTRVDPANVVVDGQTLAVAGTAAVDVFNPDVTALGPFNVMIFVDTNGNGRLDLGTDTVLGQVSHNNLAAGASVHLSIPVSGITAFRTPPLLAFLDTGNPSTLTDGQYYGNSGQSCTFTPLSGPLQPVLKWQWTGSTTVPSSNQVMMAPAVIDLNGDGIPDVVFITFPGGNYGPTGTLRAVSGRDGSELFTVTSPTVRGAAGVAVGDLDGDGHPEIVTVDPSGSSLIAFTHDGAFKWLSPAIPGGALLGAPTIADLDRDGIPEIIIGDAVLNHDGTLRWVGGKGRGDNVDHLGPISLVANLDLTGDAEIVAGNTAYRADGSIYWHRADLPDGFNGIGNFDSDPYPEIVLVANSYVYLLEHDGTVKWGPVPLPGARSANAGGPPLIADVDGDGIPEIGVAGAAFYTVLRADGTIKWSAPVRDFSSYITGSSAFDFEGDGKVEILYGDQEKLWIFRGTDGAVVWETPSGNGTIYEYPLVVDVDGDGHADIIKVTNNYAFGTQKGLQVYSDAHNAWVPTRRLWNQHTYHITNINDDGTIPRLEDPSWRLHNSYRRNLPVKGLPVAFPDLSASYVRMTPLSNGAQITARIGNSGAVPVPTLVPVAFYDGDPQAGGTLLGTVTTAAALAPGAFEDVTLPVSLATQHSVWVVADDLGTRTSTVPECNEANNAYNSGLLVRLNHPPVAKAGGPYTGTEGTPSTLNGTGSTDPDGDPLTYVWSLEGNGVLNGATSATPTATFPDNGTFTITLRVSDGLLTHTATTSVIIANSAPQVTVGPDPVLDVGTTFLRTGSFRDPGVDTWSATVDYGDGSGPQPLTLAHDQTFTLQHVYTAEGSYAVTVTVQDDDGGHGQASLTVTARAVNQPPIAQAGGPYTVAAGSPLLLDGHGSIDPEGHPLLYAWDLNQDGVFDDATGVAPTVTFLRPGTFAVALQVSDGALTHTATTTVTVLNVAPAVTLPPIAPVAIGAALTAVGSFTDPGENTWTATVDYGDGTGIQPLALAGNQTFTLTHLYGAPGTYTVTATIRDEYDGVGQTALTVTVFQPNRAPVAVPGGPYTATEGSALSLNGTGSFDPDGDTLTYAWDGHGDGVFENATSPTPTVTFAHAGTFPVTLQVSDGTLTHTATTSVTVQNVPPTVTLGPDVTLNLGTPFTFTTTFTDPGPGPWLGTVDYGDGQGSQPLPLTLEHSLTLHHLYLTPGTYSVTVTITDDQGAVAQAHRVVTIVQPNRAPLARITGPATAPEGSLVTLDGSLSSDPDGDALTYTWQPIAGPALILNISNAVRPTFLAPAVPQGGATVTVQLTVSDGTLTSAPAVFNLSITNVNHPPVAVAGPDQTVHAGSLVQLDGSGSFDEDGDPLTYQWTQNSGPLVALSNAHIVRPVFTAPVGSTTLSFTLTVSDGSAQHAATVTIHTETVNHPPVAHAGLPQTRDEGRLVTLDGTASSDPDGVP